VREICIIRHEDLSGISKLRRHDAAPDRDERAPAGAADHAVASVTEAAELAARFFRMIGDPTRVRLLSLLLDAPAGERSIGELVAALAAPQSRVSTHRGCLRWCGLVQARR
jgi:hypothetical protein